MENVSRETFSENPKFFETPGTVDQISVFPKNFETPDTVDQISVFSKFFETPDPVDRVSGNPKFKFSCEFFHMKNQPAGFEK